MPVALETQALHGGPPQSSILSHAGIAHLRAMVAKTREAQLYTNATLMREQWLEIDNLWLRVADQYMGAVLDLTSRGLTQTIPSLGIAASQYQAIGRMDPATTDMRASAAGNNQRLRVTPHLVPLPFAFEDYEFDITELEAVQRLGGTLDTAYTEEAQRSVAEAFERWLIQGAPEFSVDGNTIYGYRTAPGRVTGTGATWATPANVYTTIQNMMVDMLEINRTGPYGLYMNVAQFGQMYAQEGVDRSWNVYRRITESFPQIVSIKPSFVMPIGEVVLVELQRRTVDLAIKMDPANVPWEIMGGLAQHVRVIGSIVPRIKTDGANQTGIVHYTGVTLLTAEALAAREAREPRTPRGPSGPVRLERPMRRAEGPEDKPAVWRQYLAGEVIEPTPGERFAFGDVWQRDDDLRRQGGASATPRPEEPPPGQPRQEEPPPDEPTSARSRR